MTSSNLRKTLARRLRELMDATPALDTQVKVAKRTGLAQSTIGRILKGSVSATLDNIEAIATAFGTSATEMLQDGATAPHRGELLSGETSDLSPREIKTIAAVVQMLVDQHARANPGALSFRELGEAPAGRKASIERAARRGIGATTLNIDDTRHPEEDERSQRAGSPPQRRRRSGHS